MNYSSNDGCKKCSANMIYERHYGGKLVTCINAGQEFKSMWDHFSACHLLLAYKSATRDLWITRSLSQNKSSLRNNREQIIMKNFHSTHLCICIAVYRTSKSRLKLFIIATLLSIIFIIIRIIYQLQTPVNSIFHNNMKIKYPYATKHTSRRLKASMRTIPPIFPASYNSNILSSVRWYPPPQKKIAHALGTSTIAGHTRAMHVNPEKHCLGANCTYAACRTLFCYPCDAYRANYRDFTRWRVWSNSRMTWWRTRRDGRTDSRSRWCFRVRSHNCTR